MFLAAIMTILDVPDACLLGWLPLLHQLPKKDCEYGQPSRRYSHHGLILRIRLAL